MTAADINIVKELARELFKDEWSQETWLTEINNNISYYSVLEITMKL